MEQKFPIVDPAQPVDYASSACPTTYCCHECGAKGVKLWREYNSFLSDQTLLCATCSGKEQEKDVSTMDAAGMRESEIGGGRTDQIGWRIPAVPTEANDTYWGYTSVPEPGVQWWKRLPLSAV